MSESENPTIRADTQAVPQHAEGDRVDARKVALASAGLLLLIALAAAAVFLLWNVWSDKDAVDARHLRFKVGNDAPLLESAPQSDRAVFEAGKQRLLHEWRWVDRRNGVARIPLDQAMRIMAARAGNDPAQSSAQSPESAESARSSHAAVADRVKGAQP